VKKGLGSFSLRERDVKISKSLMICYFQVTESLGTNPDLP
ncbi:18206_t:CDS:1, partial [Dentiscutata erythropus]